MSGDAALAAYAARLRSLQTTAVDAAKVAAPLIEEAAKAPAAAGTAPDGTAWQPKKDNRRALPNAASAIVAVANGTIVTIKLAGVYVFHHFAKPKYRRAIIPRSGESIPQPIKAAIEKAFVQVVRSKMGM